MRQAALFQRPLDGDLAGEVRRLGALLDIVDREVSNTRGLRQLRLVDGSQPFHQVAWPVGRQKKQVVVAGEDLLVGPRVRQVAKNGLGSLWKGPGVLGAAR